MRNNAGTGRRIIPKSEFKYISDFPQPIFFRLRLIVTGSKKSVFARAFCYDAAHGIVNFLLKDRVLVEISRSLW